MGRKAVMRGCQILDSATVERIRAKGRFASVYSRGGPKLRQDFSNKTRATLWEYGIKSRYGLTAYDVGEMWLAQSGLCAMCKGPLDHKTFHIDHNHKAGFIRGLLHSRCNLLLGQLELYPEAIIQAVSYLEEHSSGRLITWLAEKN